MFRKHDSDLCSIWSPPLITERVDVRNHQVAWEVKVERPCDRKLL